MGLLDLLSDHRVLAMLAQTGGELLTDAIKRRNTPVRMTAEESIQKFLDESDERLKAYEVTTESYSVGIGPDPKNSVKIIKVEEPVEVVEGEVVDEIPEGQAESIVSGCIPCSLGHYTTCSGLLNEAVRFSHNGLADPEVVDRVTMCLGELNALERVDLRPEMLTQLSGPEKGMAAESLELSRSTRHTLEGMSSPDDLINAAANLQTKQKQLARNWFRYKLGNLTPEDQEEINRRLEAKLQLLEEGTND